MADKDLRDLVLEALREQQERRDKGEISDKALVEYARGIPALFDIPLRTWAAWKAHNTRGTYTMNSLQKGTGMKALLVTNCSTGEVDSITPKLGKYGVDVVRVINADRGLNISAFPVPEAPLVIALVERMSGGQIQKVKDLAQYSEKAYVGLRSKASGWDTDFGRVLPELRASNEVVPVKNHGTMASVFPPHLRVVPQPYVETPEESEMKKEMELLQMFEAENAKLEAQVSELIGRLKTADEEIRRLKNSDDELRALRSGIDKTRLERDQSIAQVRKVNVELEKSVAEVKRLNTLCEMLELKLAEVPDGKSAQRQVEAYKKGQEELTRELGESKELVKKQTEELYRLRNAAPISVRPTMKATEDFVKVRDAFKTLWRTGAMKGDDILKTLMEWEPKE